MRVFATDLDGVLADSSEAIIKRGTEHFGDYDADPALSWEDRFGVDKNEWLQWYLPLWKSPQFLMEARPMRENIEQLHKWVLDYHYVPNIITVRDPETLPVTEMWLAEHNVPYSGLLAGVTSADRGKMCFHLGARFYVDDTPSGAEMADGVGVKAYLLNTPYNQDWVVYSRVKRVDSLAAITERLAEEEISAEDVETLG